VYVVVWIWVTVEWVVLGFRQLAVGLVKGGTFKEVGSVTTPSTDEVTLVSGPMAVTKLVTKFVDRIVVVGEGGGGGLKV